MLNRVILIGRLCADPELRNTSSGVAVATFTLAVDRPGTKDTDFLNIVTWRGSAENCATYLKKGRMAAVEGRIQIRNYEKDGKKIYVTEIHADNVRFLEHDKKEEESRFGKDVFKNDGKPIDITDDDLPF